MNSFLDQFTKQLDTITIWWSAAVMVFTIIVTPIALIKRNNIRNWFTRTRNRFPDVGGEVLEDEVVYDGIVQLIGLSEQTQPWVLQKTNANMAVFVHSSDQKSRSVAENLREQMRKSGKQANCREIEDDLDPATVRRVVRHAIEELKEKGCHDIAVDVTGGRVSMSIGAFMAAEESGCKSINAPAQKYVDRKPVPGSIKLIVLSDPV